MLKAEIMMWIFFGVVPIIITISLWVVVILTLTAGARIKKHGIEAEAMVYRTEFDNGKYVCFIHYIGDDNEEHNAKIFSKSSIPVGDAVKVKYLSGYYDDVLVLEEKKDAEF